LTLSAPELTLNALLELSDLPPSEVLIFRHRPNEKELNRIFNRVVSERSDLFDCYQSSHSKLTEAALKNARYLASFIRHTPKTALFVGLYEVTSNRRITMDACVARPLHQELMNLGMRGKKATETRNSLLEFTLSLTEWHSNWRGRLIIRWPGLERSWYRWGHKNEFPVEAIARENLLHPTMPAWDELVLSYAELALLPTTWQAALGQWRGIYLITDTSDGKQYVGSAYGADNILQRWKEYDRTGHGGNRLLRERDARNFNFAILERVSPDLPDLEVIRIESNWKARLHTREPNGLNQN